MVTIIKRSGLSKLTVVGYWGGHERTGEGIILALEGEGTGVLEGWGGCEVWSAGGAACVRRVGGSAPMHNFARKFRICN